MLKEINVRFFVADYETNEEWGEPVEVEYREFVERYAENPHGRVDIEKHSVFANGVRQLCITLHEH